MENKYFVNIVKSPEEMAKPWWNRRDKEEKPINNGCSWRQLLYWCHLNINGDYIENQERPNHHWTFENSKYNDYFKIEDFFGNFRNNPNDGTREKGHWSPGVIRTENIVIVGPLRSWEKRTKVYEIHGPIWYPPKFTPKRYQVTDSFGRIIPSGFIRSEYMKYFPNDADAFVRKSNYRSYRYRSGATSRWQKGRNWRKYSGDHCGSRPWKRDFYAARIEQKEIFKEYGVTFRMPDRIPYPYHVSWQRGWKRSRKQRQWMKFGWKKIYQIKQSEE